MNKNIIIAVLSLVIVLLVGVGSIFALNNNESSSSTDSVNKSEFNSSQTSLDNILEDDGYQKIQKSVDPQKADG